MLDEAVRNTVFGRDGFKCVECGSKESLAVDHIVPQILGGGDDFPNLQTLCRTCNSAKQARMNHVAVYGVSISTLRDWATVVIGYAMGMEMEHIEKDKGHQWPTGDQVDVAFRVLREIPGLGIGRDVKPQGYNGITQQFNGGKGRASDHVPPVQDPPLVMGEAQVNGTS